jgi:hypothetical protein
MLRFLVLCKLKRKRDRLRKIQADYNYKYHNHFKCELTKSALRDELLWISEDLIILQRMINDIEKNGKKFFE